MIKINIENPNQVENEYVNNIIERLAKRVRCVNKALSYLNGSPVDIEDGEITFMKTATFAIIKKIDSDKENEVGRKYSSGDFNSELYESSIQQYIGKINSLDRAQLDRISVLFEQLLAKNNTELKNLLKCKPIDLKTHFNRLVTNLILPNDLFYIKLGFNYEDHNQTSKLVRAFYRDKNFIKYCPYCNLDKVEYFEDAQGETAARHDLDHFYDKASFPLLCYSMYNLVPSDTTCNQTNKGTIEFTEEYHLNPYQDGFNDSLVFKTALSDSTKNRYKVVLQSNVLENSERFKKILGKHNDSNNLNFGNINAFKLNTRYENEEEHVNLIASKMDLYDKSAMQSIERYVKLLKKSKLENSYKEYYKQSFHTPYDKESFANNKYAKLNRDIHDHYYDQLFGSKKSLVEKLEYIFYKGK
jgi:hypothetical protein